MNAQFKVSITYQDNFVTILEWLHEHNIRCKKIEYDFPLGGRPGFLELEFFQASHAILFKLVWT